MALKLDPSMFPRLSTRKALIVVDAQNDFLSPDGAVPVEKPAELTDRIAQLVTQFRPHGPVVWVRTEFERKLPASSEPILTSDAPMVAGQRAKPRGRRPQANPHDRGTSSCPEAFLSNPSNIVVRKDTPGADFPAAIKRVMEKKDVLFVKSHYSAFKSPDLLERLRMRLVTEVFLCGSLTNIGVQATAMDAAGFGLEVTIIEDCCGHRNATRHETAIQNILEHAGFEAISAKDLKEVLSPKGERANPPVTSPEIPNRSAGRATVPPDLESALANMSLDQKPATKPEADAPAEATPDHAQLPKKSSSRLLASPDEVIKAPDDARDAKESLSDLDSALTNMTLNENESNKPDDERAKAALHRNRLLKESSGTLHASPEDDLNAAHSADESEKRGPAKPPTKQETAEPHEDTNQAADEPNNTPLENDESDSKSSKDPLGEQIGLDVLESSGRDPINGSEKESQPLKPTSTDEEPAGDMESKANRVSDIEAEQSVTMNREDKHPHESKPLCEGDTKIVYNVLPEPLSEGIFERIRDEIRWQRMSHQGGEVPRLVSVQGEVDKDGNIPIYRHPADESPPLLPFSPTVRGIKDEVEKRVGHELNHALIQFYRNGNDYISEHSDKTLDIAQDSYIVNVSLGAERTMVFRTKRHPKAKDAREKADPSTVEGLKREVHRAQLPHNSLCQMGLRTNMRWLHAIRQDKRLEREKSEAELAFEGGRISLTFRKIGTFLDRDGRLIWGQGARGKTREEARDVVNGQTPEAVKMIQAFGRENQSTEFDWREFYGDGFDVLHISSSPRLFTSSDPVDNMAVQLQLAEYGVGYAKGSISPPFNWDKAMGSSDKADGDKVVGQATSEDGVPQKLPIKFVDNDTGRTTCHGIETIMPYIQDTYGKGRDATSQETALERFRRGLSLRDKRRAGGEGAAEALKTELDFWEARAEEADFIDGPTMGLADFAVWPALHEILTTEADGLSDRAKLRAYYERVADRDSGKSVLALLAKSREQSQD